MKHSSLERKAPIIATAVALILAILKFSMWILSGSVALLSSAVDSLLDTLVSIFNYFAIRFSQDPADKEHNYGHGKMEGVAATFGRYRENWHKCCLECCRTYWSIWW